MRRTLSFTAAVITLTMVILLVAGGCVAPATPTLSPSPTPVKPIVLRFANFPPAPTFPCVSMERWADEVEKRTNGKVKIQTFPGGSLLTAKNMWDGVLAGTADIGCDCTSYFPGRFPLLSFDRAVGEPSSAVGSRVVWEIYKEFKPASLADFKVLHMYTSGPHKIVTIDPVRTLEDLKGLELRAAPTSVDVLKALGAAPVGMPMSELPEALQKGVVKGYHSSLETLLDFKYAEICKYAVNNHTRSFCIFAVVMNKDSWNRLPEDVKKVMDDLALEQSVWTGEYMDRHTVESVEWAVKEQGFHLINLSPEEKARWDERVKQVVDKYLAETAAKGLPGKKVLDRWHELVKQFSK